MAAAATAVFPAARRAESRSRIKTRRAEVGLVLVAILFLSMQLILVPRPFGFTTDEATYLAMVDPVRAGALLEPRLGPGESRCWRPRLPPFLPGCQ